MHLLVPLLVAAAAVCAIARPPGPSQELDSTQSQYDLPPPSIRGFFNEYYFPRLLMTQYMDYDGSPVVPHPRDEWLNKPMHKGNECLRCHLLLSSSTPRHIHDNGGHGNLLEQE
ncbi:hypothetical protein evm_011409 [Chilo suppressalis]|nr:hypothetical protein evm_011409 [Chilo suppressalis]